MWVWVWVRPGQGVGSIGELERLGLLVDAAAEACEQETQMGIK